MPSVTAGSPHASPYARACGCELLNIACMRFRRGVHAGRPRESWGYPELYLCGISTNAKRTTKRGSPQCAAVPFFCAVTKLGRGAYVNYVISLERICVALRSTSCYVILKINMYARTIIH